MELFRVITKKTIISPIFKSGNPEEINNYRPISVISNIAKIFEKVVKKRILQFIRNNNIIHDNQFGFMENRSTQDAIAKLSSSIHYSLDQSLKSIGIFIDLRKAFDSISHSKLELKLKNVGIESKALAWIKSYLNQRPQVVKINNVYSQSEISEFGIPQGTVLGPLLFIIYVNSIFNLQLNGKIISYADDTVITIEGPNWKTISELANSDMNTLKHWFDENLLSLNTEKTYFIPFSINKLKTDPEIEITIHNYCKCNGTNCKQTCSTLSSTNRIKYLGIFIDQNLKWTTHIDELVKRIRKCIYIYIFIRLRNILNIKQLKNVYYSIVQSMLQYGIVGWGGSYNNIINSVKIVQKLIIKVILKKPSTFETELLFKIFNVPTIDKLYKKYSILQIHKDNQHKNFVCNQSLRYQNNFKFPKFNTKHFENSFTYQGIKFFNDLPNELKTIKNFIKFKTKLKSHMLPKLP